MCSVAAGGDVASDADRLRRAAIAPAVRDDAVAVVGSGAVLWHALVPIPVTGTPHTRIHDIRGYRAGLARVSDPKNREIAEAIVVANARDMTPALAHRACDVLLRSKFGEPNKTLADPARYIDPSYRDRAMAAPPAH
jgi:hypothetical protein